MSWQPTFAQGDMRAWTNHFIDQLHRVSRPSCETLEFLQRLCREPRRVRAKCDIVLGGAPSGQLHILLGGWACRTRTLTDGRRQITTFLLAGDICDLDTLYIDPSAETVSALTDCEVAIIPHSRVRELARHDAGFAEALGWFAAFDKVVLGARIASLGQRPARERAAHLLCELITRLRARGEANGDSCRVPLTQEQLGEALGLTTVHVNRVLQGLRADNVVARDGDRLTILDWEGLQAIGCFSPTFLQLAGRTHSQPVG